MCYIHCGLFCCCTKSHTHDDSNHPYRAGDDRRNNDSISTTIHVSAPPSLNYSGNTEYGFLQQVSEGEPSINDLSMSNETLASNSAPLLSTAKPDDNNRSTQRSMPPLPQKGGTRSSRSLVDHKTPDGKPEFDLTDGTYQGTTHEHGTEGGIEPMKLTYIAPNNTNL